MVRVSILGLNDVGEQIVEWLHDREDAAVLDIITTHEELDALIDADPQLVISAGYRHIVPEKYLDIPEYGAVNLHKSYLPYNRGANPNVWSIVEDNPAGVSIHYMTPAVDAGPIIDRRKVSVYPDDNARDLYQRLERTQVDQFRDVWPTISQGTADTISQEPDEGSSHRKQEFVDLWELDREETTNVGSLLDRLRALTFPPYDNAYFEIDGERYYVDIDIRHEDETDSETTDRRLPTYTEDDYE